MLPVLVQDSMATQGWRTVLLGSVRLGYDSGLTNISVAQPGKSPLSSPSCLLSRICQQTFALQQVPKPLNLFTSLTKARHEETPPPPRTAPSYRFVSWIREGPDSSASHKAEVSNATLRAPLS